MRQPMQSERVNAVSGLAHSHLVVKRDGGEFAARIVDKHAARGVPTCLGIADTAEVISQHIAKLSGASSSDGDERCIALNANDAVLYISKRGTINPEQA